MVSLYITRHGETEENAAQILQGIMEGHLTAKGMQQAKDLREELKDIHLDAIVSSDLKRTRDTTAILNEERQLPVVFTPLLRERDWGELTGKSIVTQRIPQDQFPPSVESVETMSIRARALLRMLLEQFDGKTVLAVGHGLFDRCILATLGGVQIHDIPRWGNAEVRHIDVTREALSKDDSLDDVQVSAD